MFGFPQRGYYSEDPFGFGGGFRQQPRRTRQAQQPHHVYPQRTAGRVGRSPASYSTASPFEEIFEDPYAAARLRKQQQLEEQRRRQEEQRQLALMQQQKRRKLLRRYNDAATTIQRAYRKHLAAKQQLQKDAAARVIANCVRAYPKVKAAKKVQKSLRQLYVLRNRLARLIDAYYANPFGYRSTLYFVDQVEKIIFQLDDVPHHRNEFVRAVRKQIVREAQAGLAYADIVTKMFSRKARKLGAAVRHYLATKDEQHCDRAARVVQRVIRAFPKVREARKVRSALASLSEQHRQLQAATEAYKRAVEAAQAAMDASRNVLTQTGNDVLKTYMHECEALVSQLPTAPAAVQCDDAQSTSTSTPTTTPAATGGKRKNKKNKKRKHKRAVTSNKRPAGELIRQTA